MTKRDFRPLRALALCLVLIVVALVQPSSADAGRGDPLAGLDRDQRRVFQAYTRLFCQQFFQYDRSERYVILPNYFRSRENSTGLTYGQVEEMMTKTVKERRGLTVIEKKIPPPAGEVIARAKVIPAVEVGHYGFINSMRVRQVVGEQEMIVTDILLMPRSEVDYQRVEENKYRWELIDRQQQLVGRSYRLLGFSTKGLDAGDIYTGPQKKGLQVAVMSTDRDHEFVMVNYDKLDRVRTSDFADVLEYVQISPLEFIDMVRANREADITGGDLTSLRTLYQRFYNRYRPAKVSAAPPVYRPEPKPEPIDTGAGDGGQPSPPVIEDKPQIEDKPKPRPRDPEPADEPVEDDWEPDDAGDAPKELDFFGIPLGDG